MKIVSLLALILWLKSLPNFYWKSKSNKWPLGNGEELTKSEDPKRWGSDAEPKNSYGKFGLDHLAVLFFKFQENQDCLKPVLFYARVKYLSFKQILIKFNSCESH